MAEMNTGDANQGAKPRKIRNTKLGSRVDLTAMVDLAFLLITFFMLTTSLTKPQAMDLTLPADGPTSPVDENRTMTVLIGADDKLQCYMGRFQDGNPKEIVLKRNAFRNELLACKTRAETYCKSIGKPAQGLIVLIKPGKNSDYGNLVDVLDEMAIAKVPTYAITDLTPEESKLIKEEIAKL